MAAKPSQATALQVVNAITRQGPTTSKRVENFKRVAHLLDVNLLVDGWPMDKWVGFKHALDPERVRKKSDDLWPTMLQWMKRKRLDCPGFLFFGAVGRGKTAVALEVGRRLAISGYSVCFRTASTMAAEISATVFNPKDGFTTLMLKQKYFAPAVLILDDVCSRVYSDRERDFFLDLVRSRHSEGKLTLMTTNLQITAKDNQGKEHPAEGYARFEMTLDGRVLSTYSGWAYNATEWGLSLRGRDDERTGA